MAIGPEQVKANFLRNLPITVTINEEKLDEMKTATDLADLAVGTKSAVLDSLHNHPPAKDSVIDPTAHYIRTSWWSSGVEYPLITVVSSKDQLEQYAVKYQTGPWGTFPGNVWAAFPEYTDDFFTENYLVIVLLGEGSGGNRHKVEKIDANGDIFIRRTVFGTTADMAAWHIIIELKNDFKLGEYQLVRVN